MVHSQYLHSGERLSRRRNSMTAESTGLSFITPRWGQSQPDLVRKKGCHESSNEAARHPILYVSGVLVLTAGGTAAARFRNPARVLIPVGTKFPLSQDRSVINVRTTWPANRRLSRIIVVTGGMITRIDQVAIDRRNAPLASSWIYIANRSLINCRLLHKIVVEFRSIIIIVDYE